MVALSPSSFLEELELPLLALPVALADPLDASSVADDAALPVDEGATVVFCAELEAAGLVTAVLALSLSAARMGLRRRAKGRIWASVKRMLMA